MYFHLQRPVLHTLCLITGLVCLGAHFAHDSSVVSFTIVCVGVCVCQ